jgi:glycosyltransferase involved in cell wall biosynthesis
MNPIKLIEYLSSAKPIIVTDLIPIREIVNETNAILANPDEIMEWVDGILKLVENNSFAENISKNSYTHFLNQYSWKIRAKKLLFGNIENEL